MLDKPVEAEANHLEVDQIDSLIAAAGVDGAREIMDAFWRSTTNLLEDLARQLGENAFDAAACTAHAVKGSSANVGAGRLAQTTSKIETACRDQNSAEAAALLKAAQENYAILREQFDAHLAKAA